MSDPSQLQDSAVTELAKGAWDWLRPIVLGILAYMGWVFRRHTTRIEELEQHSVSREELARILETFGKETKAGVKAVHDEVRYIRGRVDAIHDKGGKQ